MQKPTETRGTRAALSHPAPLPTRVDAQVAHDLAGGRTQDQCRDRVARDLDVAESAEDVDLGVGEDDPGPGRVLDHETGLAFVAGETTDRAREVVAVERLDVLDLERFLLKLSGSGNSTLAKAKPAGNGTDDVELL